MIENYDFEIWNNQSPSDKSHESTPVRLSADSDKLLAKLDSDYEQINSGLQVEQKING